MGERCSSSEPHHASRSNDHLTILENNYSHLKIKSAHDMLSLLPSSHLRIHKICLLPTRTHPRPQCKTVYFFLASKTLASTETTFPNITTVTVHEGNTGETLAVLEGVGNQRLLGLKGDLGHLVGLQGVRLLHLLTASLLSHLPLESGDTAGSASASDETDRGVSDLDLVGDIEDLDLGIESLDGGQGGIPH